MSGWPTISEYKAALQHPQRIFTDDWLLHSTPTLDKNRLPFGIAGGFGVVFPMSSGGAKKALKCFTEGDRDLLEREVFEPGPLSVDGQPDRRPLLPDLSNRLRNGENGGKSLPV